MSKKFWIVSALGIIVLTTALPAYAQTQTAQSQGGLFGGLAGFFNGLFHHQQSGSDLQNQGQGYQQQMMPSGQPGKPRNMMYVLPSGMPTYQTMQQYRLNALVQAGKITQTQEQAIHAEQQKVQDELKVWAASQGIDESYVIGGPMMVGGRRPEMMQNQDNQGQTTPGQVGQGQTQQYQYQQGRPEMHGGQGMMRPQGWQQSQGQGQQPNQ